ncbi:MAG: DUF1573 domain-containing protein [Paludibacteraceae bacterium]|nr:DUF1573 domain-containing protein [Paludibacteraceae bacterium]
MKKVLFVAMALMFAFSAMAQEKQIVEFTENEYDFGTVKEEDNKVSHVFTFTNMSQTPVTVTNVRASCGCTTPEWSREPIYPGQQGVIKATYSAKGRPGRFHKSITVTLNNGTEDFTVVLYIKGSVTPSPENAKAVQQQ